MTDHPTKAEKRALRAAAELAYQLDRSMNQEDRQVFYLEAGNPELAIVVGSAVARGVISIDQVGEAAHEIVQRVAAALEAIDREPVHREEKKEDDDYDPDAKISLSAVLKEVDFVSNGCTLYINRRTGEVRTFNPEWDEDEEDPEESEDADWVAVLEKFDLDEYDMMRRFARRASPAASRDLEDALHGRGAFRRFQDVIHRRKLQDAWNEFKDARIADLVRFRLGELEIPFRK